MNYFITLAILKLVNFQSNHYCFVIYQTERTMNNHTKNDNKTLIGTPLSFGLLYKNTSTKR